MFSCDKCVKTFSRKDNLEQHKKAVHGPNKDVYHCPICFKSKFSRKPNLRKHIRTSHGDLESSVVHSMIESTKKTTEKKVCRGRPTCRKCNKSFANDRCLKIHSATYHKVRY